MRAFKYFTKSEHLARKTIVGVKETQSEMTQVKAHIATWDHA